MELQQLKYFQTVARLEHFTRAAEELYIAQPTLSRSIARLEEELGAPLFIHQGRRVKLSRLGQLFLKRVDAAFWELEEGRREINDWLGPQSGQVSLAFLHSVVVQILPGLLGAFREQYPGIDFRLYQNSSYYMLDQLQAGEVDLCISLPDESRAELEFYELLNEELFLAVPPDHRLAGKKQVKLIEVAEDNFISLKQGYAVRNIVDRLCQQAGFEPRVSFEGEELNTSLALVAAGMGVAVIPALVWQYGGGPEPARLRIVEPSGHRTIALAWARNRYMAASARLFRQFVLDYFARIELPEGIWRPSGSEK